MVREPLLKRHSRRLFHRSDEPLTLSSHNSRQIRSSPLYNFGGPVGDRTQASRVGNQLAAPSPGPPQKLPKRFSPRPVASNGSSFMLSYSTYLSSRFHGFHTWFETPGAFLGSGFR